MGGYREHGKEPEALEVCVWQEGGMHAAALEAFCNLLTSAWTGGGGEVMAKEVLHCLDEGLGCMG